jgi:DNA-binding IclR family transcriptional regulator
LIVTEQLSGDQKEVVLEEPYRAHRLGYSVSDGDFDGRISTLSAPVMNLRNEPVAAIGIVIKSAQFDPPEARQYSKNLVQAARQLSARII